MAVGSRLLLLLHIAAANAAVVMGRAGGLGKQHRQLSPIMMTRVQVRTAAESELRPSDRNSAFPEVAQLCAKGLFQQMDSPRDEVVLASALGNDLIEHFSRRNREKNALLIAETPSSEIVGSVGIEVVFLSEAGYSIRRQRAEDEATMAPRPLLSNLVVDRSYRRRGIAKRLCKAAEAAAKEWGYGEVYLKVEKDNRKARSLYRKLGYRPVPGGEDADAERPVVLGGRLRYEPTTTIAMRKDLGKPPLDVVLKNVLLLMVGAVAVANAQAVEQAALDVIFRILGPHVAADAKQALEALGAQL
eukprot:scaffold1241_cov25-Tisochrysis_lutea.AAC.2